MSARLASLFDPAGLCYRGHSVSHRQPELLLTHSARPSSAEPTFSETHQPASALPVAVAFMLLASALLAGTSLLAKTLGQGTFASDGQGLHVFQISFGRFVFAFIAISAVVFIKRPGFGPVELPLHIARTTAGWTGITLAFAALIYIPLSDAQAINFLNPVFAMIFAIPLLKERVGPWRWIAAVISFAGALILLRPSAEAFRPEALFALGSALVVGLEVVLIKRLSGRQKPLQILLTNNAIGLVIATAAVLFVWTGLSIPEWILLAALGVTMICAQACFIQAMRRAEASLIISVSLSTLPFVTFLDYIAFGVVPDLTSLVGAGVILAGSLLLFRREMRAARRARIPTERPVSTRNY